MNNKSIKIIFLIFSFFMLKRVENKIVTRGLEYIEMEETNGNTTITPPDEPIKPKPTLLGFGYYKEDIDEKKISFNVFIKKLVGGSAYKFIYFTVKIFFESLRGLNEGDVEIKVTGELENENENYYSYKVNINTTNDNFDNNKKIDTINFKNDFQLSNSTEEFQTDYEVNEGAINTGGQSTTINIKNEKGGVKNYVYFKVTDLNNINNEFELYGYLTYLVEPYDIKNGEIEINYEQDYFDETMKGHFEKIGNSGLYCIKFKIKNTINTNLEGAWADLTNSLALNLRNLNTNEKLLYLSQTPRQALYIHKEYNEDTKLYFHNKKNSSGLSGGAIAGIVIGCIVVLVALSIAFIFLRKVEKQPQLQSSAIDFYNYNSTAQINANP